MLDLGVAVQGYPLWGLNGFPVSFSGLFAGGFSIIPVLDSAPGYWVRFSPGGAHIFSVQLKTVIF